MCDLRRKEVIEKMKIFDYADMGCKKSWDYSMNGTTPEIDGIHPILTTEKDVSMGDLLIINGTAYCICSMSGKGDKRSVCYVERLKNQAVFIENEEPEEQDYTDEITCPYCGYEMESLEMSDDEEEYICESCHSTFSYQRDITIRYCSQPVKKADVVRLEES